MSLRTGAAANARHRASQPAKQAVLSQIRNAKKDKLRQHAMKTLQRGAQVLLAVNV